MTNANDDEIRMTNSQTDKVPADLVNSISGFFRHLAFVFVISHAHTSACLNCFNNSSSATCPTGGKIIDSPSLAELAQALYEVWTVCGTPEPIAAERYLLHRARFRVHHLKSPKVRARVHRERGSGRGPPGTRGQTRAVRPDSYPAGIEKVTGTSARPVWRASRAPRRRASLRIGRASRRERAEISEYSGWIVCANRAERATGGKSATCAARSVSALRPRRGRE